MAAFYQIELLKILKSPIFWEVEITSNDEKSTLQ